MSFSFLNLTLVAWAGVTAVFVLLMICRSLIAMREEDQLFLDSTESKMEADQRAVQHKLSKITPYTKGFGFASLGLLALSCGIWLYHTIQGFNTIR